MRTRFRFSWVVLSICGVLAFGSGCAGDADSSEPVEPETSATTTTAAATTTDATPPTTAAPATTIATATTEAPVAKTVLAGSGCSGAEGTPCVLIMPRINSADMDHMLTDEVGVMLSMLEAAGVETVVASPNGAELVGPTMLLEVALALADVVVSDYDGVMLACMGAGSERNEYWTEIVREAAAAGVPVTGQYGTIPILAEAGILDGREYAAGSELFIVQNGTFSGHGVIADGNVITSGTCARAADYYGRPDGTPELTRLFIEALG